MSKKDKIRVSIICNVYNHAAYVRSALEGFLSQKTSFGFEVLIHDDASTDESAEIIREYETKYPDIVKPIYQKENQHSKNIPFGDIYQYPRAKGDYIALCEGDDYWIDQCKLQKQFDYMEEHETCVLCFSNAYCEEDGRRTRKVIPWVPSSKVKEDGIYDFKEIEELGYIPTASFFYRKQSRENFPSMPDGAFKGDGYWKLSLTLQGCAYCLPECTCVYRFGVEGSATTKWRDDSSIFLKRSEAFILMYREFNRITGGEYNEILTKRILEWEYAALRKTDDYIKARDVRFFEFAKKQGPVFFLKHCLFCYFPSFHHIMRKAKNSLQRVLKSLFQRQSIKKEEDSVDDR